MKKQPSDPSLSPPMDKVHSEMTSPDESDVDVIREAELLDSLLAAIQTGNAVRREELLKSHPRLRDWVDCLSVLNSFGPREVMPELAPTWLGTESPTPAQSGSPANDSGVFGKYELLGEVGRGGMGVVYKARQRDLNRIVALKMILASQWASPEEIRRFQAEAQAAARLRHRNIVGIHEIGEESGRHFFAMDFVEGDSLARILTRGPLAAEQATRWMVSIAQAVQHLHAQGIIHRDLKPSNVIIDSDGEPIVMDFGLAKVFDSDHGATRSGAILGTPSYMSPEQAAGRNSLISARSDVYSLGAMLYEMLSGRPPFREETPLDTLVQVIEGEPTLLRRLVSTIPRELELICFKCLEKDPARRYATADELAADLTRFLQDEPVNADFGGWYQSTQRWVRRQPNLVLHLTALAVAIGLSHLWYWFSEPDPVAHWSVILVLIAWGLSSVLWQVLQNHDRLPMASRAGAIVCDAALLTTALVLAGWTNGTLLVVYPLMIVASGLWFRVSLVWVTTIASEAAFAVLLALTPDLREPWHHPLIVATVMLFTGAATAFQVQRVRALSRFYDHRPL
jgi:eukaryotic-like serine/threonine-protein kinase